MSPYVSCIVRSNYADFEKLVNLVDNQLAEMQARTRLAGQQDTLVDKFLLYVYVCMCIAN